jgi:hypothetical protein
MPDPQEAGALTLELDELCIFSKNRGKTFVLMSIPERAPTYSN